jgi:hypothetical protein
MYNNAAIFDYMEKFRALAKHPGAAVVRYKRYSGSNSDVPSDAHQVGLGAQIGPPEHPAVLRDLHPILLQSVQYKSLEETDYHLCTPVVSETGASIPFYLPDTQA